MDGAADAVMSPTWIPGLNSRVFSIAVALLVAWVVLKVVVKLRRIPKELFLFWNFTVSRSSHSLKKQFHLNTYLCNTASLDEIGINELYHFYKEDFPSVSGMTAQDTYNFVMRYTHVLMCRDRVDGTLRGSMLIQISHKSNYTLIELGRTTFKTHYRGSPFLKIVLNCLILGELLQHPLTPVYVVGKVFTHTSYLYGVTLRECHPVYDKETPDYYREIFAEFAASALSPKGEKLKYNPKTFMLEQEGGCLEDNTCVLTEEELQNPHVKFFLERNPGWRKGHCLIVGFRMTWRGILRLVAEIMKEIVRRVKQEGPEGDHSRDDGGGKSDPGQKSTVLEKEQKPAARPKLLKRYTFQDLSANTYAVSNLEYDMIGGGVLSPSSKAVFEFQIPADDPSEMDINLPKLI